MKRAGIVGVRPAGFTTLERSMRERENKRKKQNVVAPQPNPRALPKNEPKKVGMPRSAYHERQKGGLCRMHCINNLVGKKLVNELLFIRVRDLFGERFNCKEIVKKDFTTFNLFRENISLFAIRSVFRFPSFSLFPTTAQQELKELGLKLADIESPLALCWDQTHIWACRRVQGVWYSCDSRHQHPRPEPLSTNKNVARAFVYAQPAQCDKLKLALELHARTAKHVKAEFFFPLLAIYVCYKHPETKKLLEFSEKSHRDFTFFKNHLPSILRLLKLK